MIRVVLTAAISVLSTATMSMAASHDYTAFGPQVGQTSTVSASSNWSGFYLGGSIGTVTDGSVNNGATNLDIENANPIGVFLGYQRQVGEVVVGVEYSTAVDGDIQLGNNVNSEEIVYGEGDLKARLGYGFGQLLGYAVVSVSAVVIADSDEDVTAAGFGFGFGADYAVSDNFIVGAEFMVRDIEGEFNPGATDVDVTANSFSIRAAYKF